jgi:hypothetical protein
VVMPHHLSGGLITNAPLLHIFIMIRYLQCSVTDATAAFTGGIYVCLVRFTLSLFLLIVIEFCP